MCVEGGREGERERGVEIERTIGLLQSVRVVFFFGGVVLAYFVSCNGPCAPKEKWHRKEHIIIIIINKIRSGKARYAVTPCE